MKRNFKILVIGCLICLLGVVLGIKTQILDEDMAIFHMFGFEEEVEIDPIIIVLDSGHSRVDGGAVGIVNEEWITEETTENLRELLEADERFAVVLTHTYDTYVSITERRERAEAANADLFISIHCNANEQSADISGFEVYPQLPENPMWSESYYFANMIVDGFLEAGHTPRKESGIFYVHYEENSDGTSTKYTLTEAEEDLYDFTGETLGVLKSEQFPSILIEQGYVTCPNDVENWMSTEGCQKAAELYYNAICQYFEEKAAELEEIEAV
ncbi:N-acetylmuramoyl-L-alanine amidase [Chakrabartyella piscis]|uniref:N-acetylmuramoyl-L-alanine amidase family protein n=1 Tax=Chakrabartyella piscis TaxID=2918914 RepID=UPI00295878A7|nr:N-acetylmuramoyl-L-alanine amidase [Chakrabartyella piscis]